MLQKYKIPSAFIGFALFLFPLSYGIEKPGLITADSAIAMSAKTIPIGTNLIVEIAKNKNPSVVFVTSKTKFQPAKGGRPFGNFNSPNQRKPFSPPAQPRQGGGTGTGFIIDSTGLILTNNHVVEGAGSIKITLQNEKEYEAQLIGSDPKTDIALIKIIQKDGDKASFPFLTMGNSEKVEVGEWVVAIGNPFGLSHTVTTGVVSAMGRNIGAGPYDEFIQTDASINPGNSGGPLLNMNGDVVGINTAIYSGSGGNVGIGFALPINMAKSILLDLKQNGKVTRGWLGVMIQKITPELQESFKLESSKGALVNDIAPNGPAAQGGMKRGDVITRFNGVVITHIDSLPKQVAAIKPGKSVLVEVIREGKVQTLNIKIEPMKEEKPA
ncbi:MAG: trypsin-like serine protease [Nitrospinaceae bacterium]|jgi:serine protease Do|nr:trypsin-like serine protease [Nitrospina sp.]MBT5867839.1 trypsin-like serine protease [Nitrospinaceae bacterium]MBT6345990.1 trypsin-like serine protease [Nitrospina sp.]